MVTGGSGANGLMKLQSDILMDYKSAHIVELEQNTSGLMELD